MPKTSKTYIYPKFSISQIYASLTEVMKFTTVLILFSLQTLFIIQKRDPIYHILTTSCLLVAISKHYVSRPSPVYLLDFSCLKPPNFCRAPLSTYIEHAQMLDFLDEKSVSFMSKVLAQSGQGERTYISPGISFIPPESSHREALKEVHLVLFPVVDDLLSKSRISSSEIDILIVNCSGFCPNPSLSSIVINKYSMREDIKSFTISGMGCSASALAIDMAQNILKTNKNSTAMILSTEILSTGWYRGKEQSMMVLNCVFRMGAAAILVTNKREARRRAKYKLLYTLRTQRAFDDKAYHSAIREEDADGFTGVTLRRDLIEVAGDTLRSNISILGLEILPYTEMLSYLASLFKKKYIEKSAYIYVPNFKSVIKHFCLPASGKSVIREIGKGLRLEEMDLEPALMTLHRFGNQSSSSLWYELSYMEAKERVNKGDKVWQLGMGSGPKCNSLIWECIRPIIGEAQNGVWADCIDQYPVSTI
ncbi:3-ketoacyl-CoA synthase 5-like [Primulina huaijiensis]|uniref:3-ketoacyl-CoA synthase 5-like n=1 Tax=Primulina huaijiensis TaxID=1492673 RepID=UPI003CC75486